MRSTSRAGNAVVETIVKKRYHNGRYALTLARAPPNANIFCGRGEISKRAGVELWKLPVQIRSVAFVRFGDRGFEHDSLAFCASDSRIPARRVAYLARVTEAELVEITMQMLLGNLAKRSVFSGWAAVAPGA
jgi:hypothetical protein